MATALFISSTKERPVKAVTNEAPFCVQNRSLCDGRFSCKGIGKHGGVHGIHT